MSASVLPPPLPLERQRIVASPPLPRLPRYFYAAKAHHHRRICTCDTTHEKAYFQPLMVCRGYKCPTRYYHAHCVGEVTRPPLDIKAWYCPHCQSHDAVPARICVCGEDLPNTPRPMVQCSRKLECRVRWYHRACIGSLEEGEEWVCWECKEGDGGDEVEEQQVQDEQSQHQHQHQHSQPELQRPQRQQFRPAQQKQKKQQHQDESEEDKDAAPSKKRVRFSLDRLSEEPVIPSRRRTQVSTRRSDRNAQDPGEQRCSESPQQPIPKEVEYCFCGKPSSMEMVACDGKKCAREWFHFSCVGMTKKTVPKGTWYCDECGEKEKSGKVRNARKGATRNRKR